MAEEQQKGSEEKDNVAEKKENSGGEEKKKEAEGEGKDDPPAPPPPTPEEVVMKVYMHCEECARKVKRCLQRFEGVEGVVANSRDHIVVVKGKKAAENPIRVAERVQRKCRRKVQLISPIPSPELEKKEEVIKVEEPKPAVVELQVVTVVLRVYMHCEACSKDIKKSILKIKGVQEAEPNLKSSEVRVKGVFDPEKLVYYIRKRTGKHAVVLKQELPPPPPLEQKTEEVNKPPPPPEQKTEEENKPPPEQKTEEENKPEGGKNNVENKPEVEAEVKSADKATEAKDDGKEETKGEGIGEEKEPGEKDKEAEPATAGVPVMTAAIVDSGGKVVGVMRKNDFYYYYPMYPLEPSYPPQIFSDENPNACIVM